MFQGFLQGGILFFSEQGASPGDGGIMDLWINGNHHNFETEAAGQITVAQVIQHLGWSAQRVAVEVNGLVVPKQEHGKTHLKSNDKVEVVTLIGGG